ncbi:Gcd10p-domain-containing protein [Gautieria morchelliformis]|nr:Gcd10p-domain-containing protein [Gautieria morchelliformis]
MACTTGVHTKFPKIRRAAMNAVAGPSNANNERPLNRSSSPFVGRKIQAGDTVLVRLPNAEIRSIKLESDATTNLGKYGTFRTNALLGQPYGLTYEIVNKGLKVVCATPIEDVEDTNATNELINDGQFVQPLTGVEIEALKQSGVRVDDIIKAQIEQHANYALKTEYSKDKYRKRKEAKFSKTFTTLEATLFHVSDYWFTKDPSRVQDIRADALAQMLSLANIHPDGRYIVVDDGGGIVVAGILERLGGKGRLLAINNSESPPVYHILSQMNFPSSYIDDVFCSINWAYTDESWAPDFPVDAEPEAPKNEKQRMRVEKRKRAQEKLNSTRAELFRGEWDALVVSSEFEPCSVVEVLEPYLAGSSNIVVHSPHIQNLAKLHADMRGQAHFLAPNITEAWTRRYQVLPGRTHPLMTTSGSAGFLLHAIKIYNDPNASAAEPARKVARVAKRKRMQAKSDANTQED